MDSTEETVDLSEEAPEETGGRPAETYMNPQPFVEYTAEGRMIGAGKQAIGFTLDAIQEGRTIIVGGSGERDIERGFYLDKSGTVPLRKPRPVIDWGFDKPTPRPREEATLPAVPACIVQFSGPLSGSARHAGGDLKLGFTLPGTYTLTFEAFPYLPATFQLTVKL